MHQKIGIYSTTQYFMAFDDRDDRLESQEDLYYSHHLHDFLWLL